MTQRFTVGFLFRFALRFALLLSLGVLGQFSAFADAHAANREWVRYNDLLEYTYLAKFYAVPAGQRDKVRMRGQLAPDNKAYKASEVVLTIATNDAPTIFHVDADGGFDLPYNPLWAKQNPMVLTSLPAGEKSSIGFNVSAVLPAETEFAYSSLMASVTQANQLVSKLAGMLSLFAPKFNGVEFHFTKPAQQTVRLVTKAGPQLLNLDSKGVIKLVQDKELMREDPQVVLSERASFADLTTK